MTNDFETLGEIIDDAPAINTLVDGWDFEGRHYPTYEDARIARLAWISKRDGALTVPLRRIEPPMVEGTPPLPAPGIYFNMDEVEYHALPALSCSGIKKLAASPMLFWASSWMNTRRERVEKAHFFVGHAYHVRLLEGSSVFASRYVLEIDRSKYQHAIESTEEIKDRISKIALPPELVTEKQAFHKPVTKVEEDDGLGGKRLRSARKEDWTRQLLDLEPDAPLWDNIVAQFNRENSGRLQISKALIDEIEIAARMIESDPEVAPIARGGYAEVTLIWYCSVTGVPMKARVDKMKVRRMVDLKTFANQNDRSVDRAIYQAIANNRLALQPTVYFEAAQEVRKLVREHGKAAIFVCPDADGVIDAEYEADAIAWAMKWASHVDHDEWSWIFQMKGVAPITRVLDFRHNCGTRAVFDEIIRATKRRFAEYCNVFGSDPWLDLAPRRALDDEDLPPYATEF